MFIAWQTKAMESEVSYKAFSIVSRNLQSNWNIEDYNVVIVFSRIKT